MLSDKVRLFVDDSPESQKAKKLLDQYGIAYESVPAADGNLPAADAFGEIWPGLKGIEMLINYLRNLRSCP